MPRSLPIATAVLATLYVRQRSIYAVRFNDMYIFILTLFIHLRNCYVSTFWPIKRIIDHMAMILRFLLYAAM